MHFSAVGRIGPPFVFPHQDWFLMHFLHIFAAKNRSSWWYVPYITLQNSALLFPSGLGGSGFDLLHLGPRALDLFDDVLNRGGPDERLGVFVPGLHKCLDRLL